MKSLPVMVSLSNHDTVRPSTGSGRTVRTLKLVVAYDGTPFAGWQRQKNAPTVQAELERAFQTILGERVRVIGAGRTDSGVHACGQVAHAAIPDRLLGTRTRSCPQLHRALNAVLPKEIVVRDIRRAPRTFHARYSAVSKWYRYTVWNHPVRPLFERAHVLHVPAPLDLAAMRRAARGLIGRHDFRAFHSAGRPVGSTVRHLRRLTISKRGPRLHIDAEADGFLYHMVRRIVGLLLEVGKGKGPPRIPPTAPARGLCLMKVRSSEVAG